MHVVSMSCHRKSDSFLLMKPVVNEEEIIPYNLVLPFPLYFSEYFHLIRGGQALLPDRLS